MKRFNISSFEKSLELWKPFPEWVGKGRDFLI